MNGAARNDSEHRYDPGPSALRDASTEDVKGVLPRRQVEQNPCRNEEQEILRAKHVGWSGADRLQELDSVSERIKNVDAVESGEWFVGDRWKPRSAAPVRELCQAAHEDGRMRFAGGVEVAIDPEMKAQVAAAKPHAAARREIRRFRFLN